MFGGLAFLVGGNMAVAASGQGGVLVRVDPEESDRLIESTNARLMEMRGRSMRGWLRVDSEDVRTRRRSRSGWGWEPRTPTRCRRSGSRMSHPIEPSADDALVTALLPDRDVRRALAGEW